MSWRSEVMEASSRGALVGLLDRQGGAEVIDGEGGAAVLQVEGLPPYTFAGAIEGATVTQGEWSAEGTLLECCAAVAARHGEG